MIQAPIRSNQPAVRNPVLALPGVAEAFAALPADSRAALVAALAALRTASTDQAKKSWFSHKAPMAAYWKAVAVYSGHFVRALKAPAV